jgi:hypothetical protein
MQKLQKCGMRLYLVGLDSEKLRRYEASGISNRFHKQQGEVSVLKQTVHWRMNCVEHNLDISTPPTITLDSSVMVKPCPLANIIAFRNLSV